MIVTQQLLKKTPNHSSKTAIHTCLITPNCSTSTFNNLDDFQHLTYPTHTSPHINPVATPLLQL